MEDAPIALKKSIIKNEQIFYQKNPESIFHVNRVLRGINSQYEKDFAPYYDELKGTY